MAKIKCRAAGMWSVNLLPPCVLQHKLYTLTVLFCATQNSSNTVVTPILLQNRTQNLVLQNTFLGMLKGFSAAFGAAATLMGGLRAHSTRAESLPWQEEGGQQEQVPVEPDFDWLMDKKRLEKVEQGELDEQAKVLLLAYPRTGSTLLGELLSATPNTSYFMEPLFALLPVGKLDWEYALEGRLETGEVPFEAVASLMAGIYSCNKVVVDRLMEWSKAPHTSVTAVSPKECMASKMILSKTVRLHGAQLEEVAKEVEGIKVVHLMRDPRAVAASLDAQPEEWGGRSASTYCRQLLADLKVRDKDIENTTNSFLKGFSS